MGLTTGLIINILFIVYKEKATGLVYEKSIIKDYFQNIDYSKSILIIL